MFKTNTFLKSVIRTGDVGQHSRLLRCYAMLVVYFYWHFAESQCPICGVKQSTTSSCTGRCGYIIQGRETGWWGDDKPIRVVVLYNGQGIDRLAALH